MVWYERLEVWELGLRWGTIAARPITKSPRIVVIIILLVFFILLIMRGWVFTELMSRAWVRQRGGACYKLNFDGFVIGISSKHCWMDSSLLLRGRVLRIKIVGTLIWTRGGNGILKTSIFGFIWQLERQAHISQNMPLETKAWQTIWYGNQVHPKE